MQIRQVQQIFDWSEIQCLDNASQRVRRRGRSLVLVGVADLWSGNVVLEKAFDGISKQSPLPKIVLAHNPDTKDVIQSYDWNLMLSGHTHGGQIRIPGYDTTRYVPVKDPRYVHGLKTWGERYIHVTRGVGNILGIRFNCRPEVSVIDLT